MFFQVEAIRIRAAGGPVWDGQEARGGKQIGAGVYLSVYPGAWPGKEHDWYVSFDTARKASQLTGFVPRFCVIYADTTALHDVEKAQIPNYFNTRKLWWSRGTEIDDYIRFLSSRKDPNKTLRLAFVSQMGILKQMLIPPGLLAADQNMGFEAVCRESVDDLPDKENVYWAGPNWTHHLAGDMGNPDS